MSLTDPKAWDRSLWQLAGTQSLSGEVVTESTALGLSAVYNAIALIAGTIGALPLHLMQTKGEKKRIADDYPIYDVLHDAWNPYMTAMAGRECLMAHILAWGNGYAEIERNGYGDIVALWPITPDRVTPKIANGSIVYEIRMDRAAPLVLPRSRVLHVPGLGFDGYVGYSVVAMARKSIGLGMALETFGARYFGAGTHPGVIVSHPAALSAQAHDNLKKSLTETYSGLGNSHRLLLLEEGMKMEKVGIPPNDSQFLESRQFSVTEIARWFNLPPHKLKDLTRSSFSNIESEQRSFFADSLLPWLVRLEQNYNLQLLTDGDRMEYGRGRLYFKHNADGILRADSAARAEFYTKLWSVGAITQNQIRGLEDMNPDPNPLANELFVPLNMVPLNMVIEKLRKEIETKQTRTLPEPEPSPNNGNGSEPKKANSNA